MRLGGVGLAVGLALVVGLLPHALAAQDDAARDEAPPVDATAEATCQPGIGCESHLPLPRYVSLKKSEGNARRGPDTSHRIDWVFVREGMPLKVTAESGDWRRVEDPEGEGGWMLNILLSPARTVLVTLDMAEIRAAPADDARLVAQAEIGVIGQVLACTRDWCRIAMDGQRGWMHKSTIWGVGPDETID